MKNSYALAALVALPALLAGCATPSHDEKIDLNKIEVEVSARTGDAEIKRMLTPTEVVKLMTELSPYADMADATYRHEFSSAAERLAHGCDYVTLGTENVLRLNLPDGWRRLDRALIERLNLERNEPADRPLRPCRSAKGLNYETYLKLDGAGQPLQAVIAFRGTENTKYQWADDWVANFSNVDFGLGANKQFTETREEGSRLVRALAQVLPKVSPTKPCELAKPGAVNVQAPIDLVGHSLGGGLAQHLAYFSQACDVRKTVTFDTSPANGWFYLKRKKAIHTGDPVIERVYLDGEALSFLRKVSTKFNNVRNNRNDYRIDFAGVSGNPIDLHSMNLLAGNIRNRSGITLEDDDEQRVRYDDKTQYPEMVVVAED